MKERETGLIQAFVFMCFILRPSPAFAGAEIGLCVCVCLGACVYVVRACVRNSGIWQKHEQKSAFLFCKA